MGIAVFKKNTSSKSYLTVSVLGKVLKLNVKYINTTQINLNQTNTEINLYLPKKYKNMDNMNLINLSIQKLYSEIAYTEIEYAMEVARHILKFAPEDYSIKSLENDYYKCSKGKIIVSPDIVRFNRDVINTTIIQAFCKIKHRQGSEKYKELLQEAIYKYNKCKNKNIINYEFVKVS